MKHLVSTVEHILCRIFPQPDADHLHSVAVIVEKSLAQSKNATPRLSGILSAVSAGYVSTAVDTLQAYLLQHHDCFTALGLDRVTVHAPTHDLFISDGGSNADEMLALLDCYAEEAASRPVHVPAGLSGQR